MATLAEMKARLIVELNREDMGAGGELESALAGAIAQAIEYHADEGFWFNRIEAQASCVAGNATVELPAGMRIALGVSIAGATLRKRALATIQPFEARGRPSGWAALDGAIRLTPIPDAAYALDLAGIAELGMPADAEANAWTEEAADLIVETAKKRLCRGVLRDDEGAAMAAIGEQEQLARLRRETRRRSATAMTSDLPIGRRFDIVAGR